MRATPRDRHEAMRRWPRVTAHMICESLGYCTPSSAAQIVLDGKRGQPNWCEWVMACWKGDARKVLQNAIRHRHTHRGFMANYRQARLLVEDALANRREPIFMSW